MKHVFDGLHSVAGDYDFVCHPIPVQQAGFGQLCEVRVVVPSKMTLCAMASNILALLAYELVLWALRVNFAWKLSEKGASRGPGVDLAGVRGQNGPRSVLPGPH